MMTFEGKKIDPDHPLFDYPYPQFQRESYYCLNGRWEFEINQSPERPAFYSKTIVVPFAPETELSGIQTKIKAEDHLHYRRYFTLPEDFNRGRVLLHFEAVDQICDVYLNGVKIYHHEGGYLPFTVDCLELKPGKNELCVEVQDDTDSPIFPRGKQSNNPKGIWYTPTSGIYGTVWLESVPRQVIQYLKIDPLFDEGKVRVAVRFEGRLTESLVVVKYLGKEVGRASFNEQNEAEIDLGNFHPWTPEDPCLYQLEVTCNEDHVSSYFAMRKYSIVEHNGHPVFGLNNKPYFLTGLLDQGYGPECGLTPPSLEGMERELRRVKEMGFNMLRKHIKIEPMTWYALCDKLGIIVIQDFVNGGAPYKKKLIYLAPFLHLHYTDDKEADYARLGRGDPASREQFEKDMAPTVEKLYNVPCIAIWTLFNEGWGQFDSFRLTQVLRKLDGTRLIDSTSGWFDQGAGDFSSHHVYFKKIKIEGDGKRILSLSEFGGYAYAVPAHSVTSSKFGYKWLKGQKKLQLAIKKLYEEEVYPLLSKGLSVAVYTQLTDVEGELNGLFTYDRKMEKVDFKFMAAINERLKFE